MFDYKAFLTEETYNEIGRIKAYRPCIVEREAARRQRQPTPNDAMVLAAADHNARMITEYKGNDIGLGNRREYLSRLARMLQSDEVDGIEAAPDIIEEVFILNHLAREKHGVDFLQGKAVIGTTNRGGLKGTAWELDDMPCCFTVERAARLCLDGVKFMLRIAPFSEENKNTLRYCAEVINEAEKAGLAVYIETLFVGQEKGGMVIRQDLTSVVKGAVVTAALGSTSCRKWLELSLNPQYDQVAASTTCPVLVVPDEVEQDAQAVVEEYTRQVGLAHNVRGILLGRNVMYSEEDPYLLAEAIGSVWHGRAKAADALSKADAQKAPKSL